MVTDSDHLSSDYCLRSCDSLLPVLQAALSLCDNDKEAPDISQHHIMGCLHFSFLAARGGGQVLFTYVWNL